MVLERMELTRRRNPRFESCNAGKLANKKGPSYWQGPFVCWLPMIDEFRNFLMSEEADIVLEHIKDF